MRNVFYLELYTENDTNLLEGIICIIWFLDFDREFWKINELVHRSVFCLEVYTENGAALCEDIKQ